MFWRWSGDCIMTEQKWFCPRCKMVYLRDGSEASSGVDELYRMVCPRCRNKGEIVLLINELGMMIREGRDGDSVSERVYRNLKESMED